MGAFIEWPSQFKPRQNSDVVRQSVSFISNTPLSTSLPSFIISLLTVYPPCHFRFPVLTVLPPPLLWCWFCLGLALVSLAQILCWQLLRLLGCLAGSRPLTYSHLWIQVQSKVAWRLGWDGLWVQIGGLVGSDSYGWIIGIPTVRSLSKMLVPQVPHVVVKFHAMR